MKMEVMMRVRSRLFWCGKSALAAASVTPILNILKINIDSNNPVFMIDLFFEKEISGLSLNCKNGKNEIEVC